METWIKTKNCIVCNKLMLSRGRKKWCSIECQNKYKEEHKEEYLERARESDRKTKLRKIARRNYEEYKRLHPDN